MKKTHKKAKALPRFSSDAKAEAFIEDADLSAYDLSAFAPVDFELEPKSRQVSLRLPEGLYKRVQQDARRRGIKAQKLMRRAIERAVAAK